MKRFIICLLSIMVIAMACDAQNIKNDGEPYEVYCACYGDLLLNGKVKPKKIIWGDLNDEVSLMTEDGKKIRFNNMVDVANYLSKRGWKVHNTETLSAHVFVVFSKTIKSDGEAKEGLYFDTDF